MTKPIDTTTKIYLCGPINGCTDAEATNWRNAVKLYYDNAIDPMKRDYRGKELTNYREIVDLDKRDIRACDIVVVNYDKPSVGTSMEVFYAWTLGKPIIVWCKEDAKLSPWLIYHSTSIVHTLDDALSKIEEIK